MHVVNHAVLGRIMEEFLAYIKLHLLSLEQDSIKFDKLMGEATEYDTDEYRELEMEDTINTGEMRATMHLLAVGTDILNKDFQGKGY